MKKYKSIYDSVEAVVYTGYNLKEVNEFCGNRLSWFTNELEWDEKEPPIDLIIKFKNDDGEEDILVPGSFMVRFTSGNYGIIEGYDFVRLFEEAPQGDK